MEDEEIGLIQCDKCGNFYPEDEICNEHYSVVKYCIYCCEECQKELRDSDYINSLIDQYRDEQLLGVQDDNR